MSHVWFFRKHSKQLIVSDYVENKKVMIDKHIDWEDVARVVIISLEDHGNI